MCGGHVQWLNTMGGGGSTHQLVLPSCSSKMKIFPILLGSSRNGHRLGCAIAQTVSRRLSIAMAQV
jgi:hypothetical protein